MLSKYLGKIIGIIFGLGLLVGGARLVYVYYFEFGGNKVLSELTKLANSDSVVIDRGKVLGASVDYEVYSTVITSDGSYSLLQLINGKIENEKFKGEIVAKMPDGNLLSYSPSDYIPEFNLADGKNSPASVVEKGVTILRLKNGEALPIKIVSGEVVSGRLTGVVEAKTVDTGNCLYLSVQNHKVAEGVITPISTYINPATRVSAFIVLKETELEHPSLLSSGEDKNVLAAQTGPTNVGVYNFDNNSIVSNPGSGTYHVVGGVGSNGVPSNPAVTAKINQIITQTPALSSQNLVPTNLSYLFLGSGSVTSAMIQDGAITSSKISAGAVTADDIATGTITADKLASGVLSTSTVSDGAVTTAKLADSAVTSSKIAGNTIGTDKLSGTLTFGGSTLIDLSQVDHSTTSKVGLILPNVSSSSPAIPSGGKGYLAYDTADKQVIFYNGTSWGTVGSGTITSVNAGNGLTGGGSSGAVTLSINSTDISGCTSGSTQKIIWDSVNNRFTCGTDQTTGGSASSLSSVTDALNTNTISNGDYAQLWRWSLTTADKTAFKFTESAASTATGNPYILGVSTLTGSTANPLLVTAGGTSNGIKIDTTGLLSAVGTGGIQATTLNGATFAAPGAIGGTTPGTGAFTTLSATGALSASNFSGSSSGTNTGDQTITLTGDVTGTGTGSFASTIGSGAVTLGKMANLAANSIIGNNTGVSATPVALTTSQVKSLLGISTSDVSGLGTIATQNANSVAITGGTLAGLTGFGIRSSGTGAYDLTIANTENLTSGRTLTITTGNASRTLTLSGDANISGTSSGTNTGDQTITLTGDVTGTGTGSFATAIGTGKVTSGMILDGTIAGGDLASNIAISTTGDITTTGTGKVTSAGAFVGPTATNTINGLIINTGALSGITTISTSSTINGATISGGTLSGGSLSGTALSGTGSFTLTGGTAASETLTLVSTSNITKGDIQFFSSANKLTSAGALTIAGALSASNFSGSSSGTNTGDQTITLTGDVTGTGTGSFAATIGSGAVTLGKMANLAANSIIGNNTGVPAAPTALTSSQVKSLLAIANTDVSGLGTISTQNANNVAITGGSLSGLTGVTLSSGNFDQSGSAGTLSTGTGAVSLNGVTTLAAGKALIITGASGNPTATAGTLWYDSLAGKFKIVEGTTVKVLCNTTDLGCGTGGGGGVATIKEGGTSIVTSAVAENFAAADFIITDETSGQAGIAIDYTNSKITRTDQAQTITGGWTFNTNPTTFSTGISANGGLTLAANQNLLFTSGTGTLSQNYSNTTGTANTLNITNSGSSGANVSTGLSVAITGTANVAGSNTVTGINFPNVTAQTNNTYNAITFGTGFNNFITSGTVNLTAAGALSGLTTLGLSGQLTSTLATGTAPFVVASTTNVANLNASSLNGATFSNPGAIGGGAAAAGTFTTLTANTSITDVGLAAAGVVTNTSGGLLGTLAGTTTTVLHGNAAGAPTFGAITGSDLASNISISTSGNIATTGTGTITSAGAITGPTAANTINGIIINSGAVSSVSTLALSGAITGATATNTINGLIINSGALSGVTTINASGQITSTLVTGTAPFVVASTTNVANLNASSLNGATFSAPGAIGSGTPGTGAFTTLSASSTLSANGGLTLAANQNLLFTSGTGTLTQNYSNTTGTANTLNVTNSGSSGTNNVVGKTIAITGTINGTGANTTTGINFANVAAATNNTYNGITFGTGFNNYLTSGTVNLTAAGALSGLTTLGLSGAITGATATNTINGLIVNSGALSGITTINASGQITSTLATGTAPFVVASTTNVVNLNASSLNGATFAAPGSIGSGTPGSGSFTTLSASGQITSGFTGNNAVLYGTTATGVLAAATTSTSGLCLVSGAATGYAPTWTTCPGGGGGIATVKEGGVSIVTSATSANFAAADFIITDETGGQAGIAIDYANSKILRSSDATVTYAAGVTFNTTGNTNGITINTATGASGNSGAITIQTGGTTTSGTSGAIVIDTGAGASANGAITIGTTNASGLTIGRATVTTAVAGTLSSTGGISLAANQGLTFVSGTGTLTQNYSNTTGTGATFNHTNSASSGTNASNVLSLAITGTANVAGSNTVTGINFPNVAAATNNTYNGITFGTGFNNFITSGTVNLTAAGALSGLTTLGLSGQLTSTLATGTAPFVVASTTNVANLNASSLNGATFAAPGTIGGGTAAAGTFTTLTANTSITDVGLSTAGIVTNTSGGLLGTLAGTTTTVLHGNAAGAPTFGAVTGSDLAANITISTTGNISTTSTGAITSAGAITGPTITNTINGIIINSGAVSGVSTLGLSGAITGATATNTINGLIINSGALSGATTLGLSGAITGATATNTINGIIINSGAVSNVSTLALSGAITGATATNTINGIVINSGAVSSVTTLGASSTVTIGTGGNTFTFNPASAPAYAGSARPDRRDELSPEYPGAVLTGAGTGTMTSDFCAASAGVGGLAATNTTVCNTSGDTHNYYNWTTSQGTAQTYSVYVKWRVPDNFAAWDTTNSIQAYAKRSDATNGHVNIKVFDTANALNNAGGTEVAGAANTWVQNGINISGGTWTAGSYITLEIDMTAAATGGVTNIGEINLNYFTSN